MKGSKKNCRELLVWCRLFFKEAQRNSRNRAVRHLREEIQLLLEPGSYVGEVVKVMGKNKVCVFRLEYVFLSLKPLLPCILIWARLSKEMEISHLTSNPQEPIVLVLAFVPQGSGEGQPWGQVRCWRGQRHRHWEVNTNDSRGAA